MGASEAPIIPELMDGYAAMGALATDKELRQLQGVGEEGLIHYRSACRPFGENCGFVMGESAQVMILMDDTIALEQGAPILGAVPFVSVHADGAKKSIPGPGAGNYLTMARAAQAARDILDEASFKRDGLVMAHGTGTPQNRSSESAIFSTVAQALSVYDWRVSAIKSHTGHSLGAAAGDQMSALLGIWESGWVPGIGSIDQLADDVQTDRLSFALRDVETADCAYALVNSKGFGGNNATATVLSPDVSRALLEKRHSASVISDWQHANETVAQSRNDIESARLCGDWQPMYRFNDGVLSDEDIHVESGQLVIGDLTIDTNERVVADDWTINS